MEAVTHWVWYQISEVLFSLNFCFHLESVAPCSLLPSASQYQTAGVWAAPGSKFLSLTCEGVRGRRDRGSWLREGFHVGLTGACASIRGSYILEKCSLLKLCVNRQIPFVWDLRSVQNQACSVGRGNGPGLLHFSALGLPLTQTFINITTTYREPTKEYIK